MGKRFQGKASALSAGKKSEALPPRSLLCFIKAGTQSRLLLSSSSKEGGLYGLASPWVAIIRPTLPTKAVMPIDPDP
jgi:hypothetical protein